jgi:hypothetical protein
MAVQHAQNYFVCTVNHLCLLNYGTAGSKKRAGAVLLGRLQPTSLPIGAPAPHEGEGNVIVKPDASICGQPLITAH